MVYFYQNPILYVELIRNIFLSNEQLNKLFNVKDLDASGIFAVKNNVGNLIVLSLHKVELTGVFYLIYVVQVFAIEIYRKRVIDK